MPEVHNLFPIAYGKFSISMLRKEVLVVDFVSFFSYNICAMLHIDPMIFAACHRLC